MDLSARIIITAALLFCSIGVWSERMLKPWHRVLFFLGLICDTWGTGIMLEIAGGMAFDLARYLRGGCYYPDVYSWCVGGNCTD